MDDSKCDCHLTGQQVCDICQVPAEDNLLEFAKSVDLIDLVEETVGKKYVFAYVDEAGNMAYLVGDDMPTEKLLMLLETIKMSHVFGLD